jgi:hypothetical protein
MVPALITAGSALTLAVAPQIAAPIVAAYMANMAVRTSFRAAEHLIEGDDSAALDAISSELVVLNTRLRDATKDKNIAELTAGPEIAGILQEVSDRLYDVENSLNLAEAVQVKAGMPDVLHIEINNELEPINERYSVLDGGS